MNLVHILYPERRAVSEETIFGWYRDAVANGEVEDLGEHPTLDAVTAALDDAGLITSTKAHFDDIAFEDSKREIEDEQREHDHG